MKIFNLLFLFFLSLAAHAQVTDAEFEKRIDRISSKIPLSYNSHVKSHIMDFMRNDKGNTSRILEVFYLYKHDIDSILKKNQLPTELSYMAISLSGCSNFETSEEGGTGFYMMRYITAKSRGLHISSYVDERRDILKATSAFAKEIKEIYKKYQDWPMTIAAYYASDLEMDRAISYSKDSTGDYWKIHSFLPFSYQKTYPKFIASAYLMNYHKAHSISPAKKLQFKTDTVPIRQYTTIYQIATKLEIDYDLLKLLNPIYKKQIIPNSGRDYYLVLPKDKVDDFYNLGEEVYEVGEDSVAAPVTPEPEVKPPSVPEYTTIYYTVRSGDILLKIADYYDCTVSSIKRWNGLRSDMIAVNQRLKIVVPTSKLDYYKKINGMSSYEKSRIAAKD
ncbi:LysM peptidoglycan-binding domain-containing protein [bacterium]|nr:LysM peptidoglycan-binding domain-containing protein [bacterium]